MRKSGSIGVLTKKMLQDKDQDWFYLNTIKQTNDPNCWKIQNKLFHIEEVSDFLCTIVLTEERICPSWFKYENKFSSKSAIANQKEWFRKAIVTISENKNINTTINFVPEQEFSNFSWK